MSKEYTIDQFYNDAVAITEKYNVQILPEHRFNVNVIKDQSRGFEFEIWFSNAMQNDDRKIVSVTERNPGLALKRFEAELIDVYSIDLIEFNSILQ